MCPLSPLGAASRVTKRPVVAAAEPSPRGAHPRSPPPPPLLPPNPWSGYHGKPHPPTCTAAPLLAGGESHRPSPDPSRFSSGPGSLPPQPPLPLLPDAVPGTGEVLSDRVLSPSSRWSPFPSLPSPLSPPLAPADSPLPALTPACPSLPSLSSVFLSCSPPPSLILHFPLSLYLLLSLSCISLSTKKPLPASVSFSPSLSIS